MILGEIRSRPLYYFVVNILRWLRRLAGDCGGVIVATVWLVLATGSRFSFLDEL